MKSKLFGVFLAGVLCLGIGSTLMAADDTSTVTVSVVAIDALNVTDGGTIILDQVNGDYLTGANDTTARLSYTHNSATNREIVASVTNIAGGATQDITLDVGVAGGAGLVNILNAGTRVATPPVVWSNIAAGAISDAVVTYDASATASGTLAGDYTITVTFTSQDAS